MRDMDVRATAVKEAFARLINADAQGLENAGQNTVAVPIMIDIDGNGEPVEVWVTAQLTVKQWKPYNSKGIMREAYDPFTAEAAWQAELAVRAAKAEQAKANKEKRIAKAKA